MKRIEAQKAIRENGIGSNYHTLDNNPISRFNDPRIVVDIFPDAWHKTSTVIECDQLKYNSGLRKFNTEQEAIVFATKVYDRLLGLLDNQLIERVMEKLLDASL